MSAHHSSFYRTHQAMPNRFGIYLHVPFCVHKCSYCDFYSFTQYDSHDFTLWRDRIVQEIAEAADWLSRTMPASRTVSSIFFGGGTPSLIPSRDLAEVFTALRSRFELSPETEITLEANPETVNERWAEELVSCTPVNRVSLGAQSFQPVFLEALERRATPQAVRQAVECLRRAGLSNFNLDLIFAIPGQTLAQALHDVECAAELGPKHLSFYNLTLKPGHRLFSQLPDDDFAADVYEAGIARLGQLGFQQYEISNFCREFQPSRHNLLYWNGGDYLGVGPSASSRFFWEGTFRHRKAPSDYPRYLKTGFLDTAWETTTPAQTLLEAAFLELRVNAGVSLPGFQERYGFDLTQGKNFGLFLREGLLERDGEILRLTSRGRLLADRVTQELVD